MSLQGLPDFQRPIRGSKYALYYPFENAGSFIVASSALEVGRTAGGRPDFALEFVRGLSPTLPPAPYCLLDFRVMATFPAADALADVRDRHPGATVAPPILSAGFLRLQPAADTGDIPKELLAPVPLTPNGLGVARFTMRVGQTAGAVIEAALRGDVLGVLAWAELQMTGVAPRVPVTASFDPSDLVGELARGASDAGDPIVTREQLEQFFEREVSDLPLRLDRPLAIEFHRDFVETLADHVRVFYGELAPSPSVPVLPAIRLLRDRAGSGSASWNLSEPLAVPRGFVASLDPFGAARDLVASEGIDAVVKRTVVPPIPNGTRRVHVSANLPAVRSGVLAMGVDLTVPPNPPHRPQAIHQTVEISPPADAGVATLRLSVAEPVKYEATAWAVVQADGAVRRFATAAVQHEGEALDLTPADFPVRFVSVAASAALLDQSTLTVNCEGQFGGEPFGVAMALRQEAPAVGVAVPTAAVLDSIHVEAQERDGEKTLRLMMPFAESTQIDLSSFPEFGTHLVAIDANLANVRSGLLAVDLVAEGSEEEEGAAETIALTTASPKKEWKYTALSLFRAGYRYRLHPETAEAPRAWSEVQPHGAALHLQASPPAARRS